MSQIELIGDYEFSVERRETEEGEIEFTLEVGNDRVTFVAGYDISAADALLGVLRDLASNVEKIISDWQDRPDNEADAFVYETRDGYTVSLEGVQVMCDYNRFGAFPSREIAEYELAKAMSERGVFPGLWYVNERGNIDNDYERMRGYHDEGGTVLLPLPGVRYEEGQHVSNAGLRWSVVKDYGSNLGVVASYYGEETRVFEHDELTALDDNDDEEG